MATRHSRNFVPGFGHTFWATVPTPVISKTIRAFEIRANFSIALYNSPRRMIGIGPSSTTNTCCALVIINGYSLSGKIFSIPELALIPPIGRNCARNSLPGTNGTTLTLDSLVQISGTGQNRARSFDTFQMTLPACAFIARI